MSKLNSPPLRTIVTGGSGALGAVILRALQKRGDHVVNLDLTKSEQADWVKMDLTSQPSVTSAVDEATVLLGGVDVLIHCAGIFRTCDFLTLSEAEFEEILNINLLGCFRVAQAVARKLQNDGGRILLISSIHAQLGVRGRLAYGVSKAGIEAMTRVLSAELSHNSIRVNALAPGAVSSGMIPEEGQALDWASVTPAGRKVTPEEVAGMALLLTDEGASFVSGQVISQDGGASVSQVD